MVNQSINQYNEIQPTDTELTMYLCNTSAGSSSVAMDLL